MSESAGEPLRGKLAPVLKPLLKASGLYLWELLRGLGLGLVVGAIAYVCLILLAPTPALPTRAGLLQVVGAALCMGLFPLLYTLAGHLRGSQRAFAHAAHLAGGPLFDHTVAPFVASVERKRPGAMAELVRKPAALAQAGVAFVRGDSEQPAAVRRLGARLIAYLVRQLSESEALPQGLVADGRFDLPAFRAWSMAQLREVLAPDWTFMGLVFVVQVLSLTGLWWWASH